MNVDSRALAWVRLDVCGVAPRPLAELLRAFGSPEAVVAATSAQRRKVVSASAAKPLDADT